MSKHCIGDSLMQCWPRQSCKVLLGLRINIAQVVLCAMLIQADQENIVKVVFQRKRFLALWANIAQVNFCAMFSQTYLDNIE